MAEVPAATSAHHLRALHEQAVVRPQLDRLGDSRLGEAGPARARLELGVGAEQVRATAGAAVHAGVLVVDILAREGRLCARTAQHLVLLGRQLLTPLLLALGHSLIAHTNVLAAR